MVLFRRSCSLLQSRLDLAALLNRASQLGRTFPQVYFVPSGGGPCSSLLAASSCRHHNSFRRGDGRNRGQPGSKQSEFENDTFADDSDTTLIRHLKRRINEQQAEVRREPIGSDHSRRLQSSIINLTGTMNELLAKREKKKNADAVLSESSIQKSPSNATIEILSNGTANLRPCVALRTTFQLYLFDCPEGLYRHLCGLRLNHRSLFDVFITRGDWEHTGGVPGVVVSKEQFQQKLRLHGPPHMKRFIETFRSFQSDDGRVRATLEVEELTFDNGRFEDEAIVVHYLPLVETLSPTNDPFLPSKRRLAKSDELNRLSLAYLVEFKKRPSRIDAAKCLAMQVPKGPMIGQLQRGKTVTLANGRVVKPEDVRLAVDGEEPSEPSFLVVNCSLLAFLPALASASALQRYKNPDTSDPISPSLKYIVHYTNEEVLRSDDYVKWMASFGPNTTHLVVNGSGSVLPHSDGVYRMQTQLNYLHPDMFPKLASHGYSGMLPNAPPDAPLGQLKTIVAEPFMSFAVRGRPPAEEDQLFDFDRDAAIRDMQDSPGFDSLYANFRREVASLKVEETFPRLTILGSSSATPTKFRNMSGYLIELSDDFCCLVDCGEGTYGQMLALFGPRRTAELLLKLKFVFVSHGHQDHVIGIFDLILERRKAFLAADKAFAPLRILAPTIVFPTMNMYDMSIEKIADYFEATLTTRPRTQEETAADLWDKQGVIDVGSYIPDFDSWPLKQIRVVTVAHPRQAKGLILVTADGKKLVFSGDSKPSERLIAAGKDADLLVHEATFSDEFARDADKKSHSTMGQAVEVGEKMKAKMVLLTHFSARYKKVPLMPSYLDTKGNVGIVMDNMSVRWSELPLVPKLIPLFREIYSNEIDDVKTQVSKRTVRQINSLASNGEPDEPPQIAKKAQRLI